MPYGDQALFTTRDAFSAAGGYRDLPLMEDLDLVQRQRKSGALIFAEGTATTSARRWQRRGVCRQTWTNWTTYLLYRWGTPPSRLARRYRGTAPNAIALFCKYPTPGTVKTRLAATEGQEAAANIYRTLVRHTLDTIRPLATTTTPYAFFTPIEAADDIPGWLGPGLQLRGQGEGDLGNRILEAFRHTLGAGADRTVIIGTDCPGLTTSHLRQAFAALDAADVVLGPTHDGGYYLIGMKSLPEETLFRDIPWSTHHVLSRTLAAAESLDLRVTLLDTLHDLDDADDLNTARRNGALDI
jgi:rSAM/selenodomain-associated transferase 1